MTTADPQPSSSKRVALITGAASGIGRAMACEMSARDWSLVLVDRDGEGLASLNAELDAGSDCRSLELDLANTESAVERIGKELDEIGRLDAFLNIAAIGNIDGPDDFSNLSPEHLRAVLEVNVLSPSCIISRVWKHLQSSKGTVIHAGSLAGFFPLTGISSYAISKLGLIGLGRVVMHEGQSAGVQSFIINLGQINTPMIRRSQVFKGMPEADITEVDEVVIEFMACLDGKRSHLMGTPYPFAPARGLGPKEV